MFPLDVTGEASAAPRLARIRASSALTCPHFRRSRGQGNSSGSRFQIEVFLQRPITTPESVPSPTRCIITVLPTTRNNVNMSECLGTFCDSTAIGSLMFRPLAKLVNSAAFNASRALV